tara:strand:+ start:302 stop:691 length:390 start_codon:yes stop_codon:yes gene_type:complete
MCWSVEASAAMVGLGVIASAVTYRRGDPPANQSVTVLSYLHIAIQPFFINAFAMELVPDVVKRRLRVRIFAVCAVAGPVLAASLTTNPNVIPAIWCLFSIAILLIGLSPVIRKTVTTTHWWGRSVEGLA